jgi:hypothetical protein
MFPKWEGLNFMVQKRKIFFPHGVEEILYLFYIQCDVVDSAGLHGGLFVFVCLEPDYLIAGTLLFPVPIR